MSFASLPFLLFLPTVYLAYWAVRGVRARNGVLLAAGVVFYGFWDVRFLALIGGSIVVDYWVALALARQEVARRRRALLALSLGVNLGALGLFKYYGFFVDNLRELLTVFGVSGPLPELDLVLPIGISFYTFQTLSYSIDVYRRRMAPTRDFVAFAAYVSFFPQLVAGPIERARGLLPQFLSSRTFDTERAKDGCRQMLWGFFKKMVVADTCARVVDAAFASPTEASPWLLLYGTVLFAVQIYCDFSGYSDIAIGCARLFGIGLSQNFHFPYFARDLREFWYRWHISLTSWFRDYVYLPLGGNRVPRWRWWMNVWIVFLVSGFWHGANWTFIVWGAIHAVFFFVLPTTKKDRPARWIDLGRIAGTMFVICVAWVFFRADSVGDAWTVLARLTELPSASMISLPLLPFMVTAFVFVVEWVQRDHAHGLAVDRMPRPLRWLMYYFLVFAIFALAPSQGQSFIYFQF